jgi:histone H1/5
MNKPVAKKAAAKKAAPAKKKAAPAKKAAAPKKVAPATARPEELAKGTFAAPAPAPAKTSAPAKKSLWKRIFGGK